ncbi:RteC domain-containing protein [Chitinophaga cymbidii]|uniref:Uncharacterized protein n=1 Tax=Chitinophaga cymbidii TaxID=1096750 RepID=A0A512RPS8_9BACT|nr:RteC domain-containing protein [Chitinophaga cymbidii]GEP97703.1 hypothetical protein CCY01nite_39630 [Chitinophaga cymbidii]
MHQLIKALPKFIHEKIQNTPLLLQSSLDEINKWLGYLEISKEYLLEEIQQDMLHYENPEQVQLYLQTQFYSISHLLNELTILLATTEAELPNTSHAVKFYERSVYILESILSHIQQYYHPCILKEMKMPAPELTKAKNELSASIALLQQQLFTPASAQLLSVTLVPLKQFMDKSNVSYKDWEYIRSLTTELLRIPTGTNTDYNCEMRKVLGNMNCNSKEFMNYMIMHVENEINSLETLPDKLARLAYIKKHIKQLQTHDEHLKYDPELPSAQHFMLQYIDDEIAFLKEQPVNEPPSQPLKTLKWKGPKVGLIEFARACKEIGALDETLQEIYTCFETFFSIRLDNPSRTFQEILSRKKDESSYLQKLAMKLKEQKDRMIENYHPRK